MVVKVVRASKEIIRVEDYASDAVVLRLTSASATKKVMALDTYDIGNHSVISLFLMFMILRSYTINSSTAGCIEITSYS